MVKLSTIPHYSFSMYNHHKFVRCPDSNFFLVLPGMIYPLMIIPLVDTGSNGEFRNNFKNTNTFLVTEKSVSLPFFDDIFKEDEGAPLSCGRGAGLMKAST